jgi:hypothetical protein
MTTTSRELSDWLEKTGWRHGTPGVAGSRWALGDSEPVGVMDGITSDMPEWNTTLARIASVLGRSRDEVAASIVNVYTDEIVFHARGNSSDSISLEEGARLVDLIKSAVRTTATTSRSQKPVINGNWNRDGDRITSEVRLGHTRKGSYAVPVYYDIGQPTLSDTSAEEIPAMEAGESTQRRASRTLMQSLNAIEQDLLRPGREPTVSIIMDLVHKGVSKELAASLASFSRRSIEVASLETDANWASGAKSAHVTSVVIPVDAEAAELLERTAQTMLRMTTDPKEEFVSGPVVGVLAKDGNNVRSEGSPIDTEVMVQTVRRGREATVHVPADASLWEQVTKWLRTGESVEASGEIRKSSGRLVMRPAQPLRSLNQEHLPL